MLALTWRLGCGRVTSGTTFAVFYGDPDGRPLARFTGEGVLRLRSCLARFLAGHREAGRAGPGEGLFLHDGGELVLARDRSNDLRLSRAVARDLLGWLDLAAAGGRQDGVFRWRDRYGAELEFAGGRLRGRDGHLDVVICEPRPLADAVIAISRALAAPATWPDHPACSGPWGSFAIWEFDPLDEPDQLVLLLGFGGSDVRVAMPRHRAAALAAAIRGQDPGIDKSERSGV